MKALVTKFLKNDDGATMLEYAMIAGLVSIVAFGAIQLTSGSVSTIWNNIQGAMADAATASAG
jgi:pilus assembly protein Flp/PilA